MANEKKIEDITCGYVMPIARTDGYPESHWKDVLTILDSVITELGITKKRIVSDGDTITTIHSRIVNNLNEDDIIICDVSSRNPNVMFELGMRIAFDKPVIIIKDSLTDYCFDSGTIEHLPYPKDLRYGEIQIFKEKLRKKIIKTHEEFIQNGDKGVSPILKNFGSFERKKIKLDKISAEEALIRDIDSIKSSLLNIQMSAPFMMNSLKDIEPEIKINPTMFSRFVKVNVKDFPLEKVDSLTSILDSERLSYELSENGYIKIKTQNPSERERAHQVLAFIRNTSP
ncbi:hypothetical protein [Leclercia adecarboxylata]|uniref:hypothetical protein n=1 Tax=Leclercia adecarboxylata TaxID=83655 RepID=UPI000E3EBEA5|nr:hypothetical protein [Leclercia adecarboxylata]MCU6672706.1 hypothetical protein [Leclercia adecarboxylata]MCV3301556.1 hypothetical protein [Leclercia adecarboxylata]MCV3306006.1 hypothetical protein [Leclercia adecarboxylata]RFS77506.1 hypothetical protein D0U00_17815 [Leclercia adecarboxylata]